MMRETLTRVLGLVLVAHMMAACASVPSVPPPPASRALDEGVDDLGRQIDQTLRAQAKRRVAVVELMLEGRRTRLGRYIEEKLHNRLFLSGRFELVERSQLAKVLRELALAQERAATFDPATVKEIGRLVGADAIVTGILTDLGAVMDVNVRMIAADTGVTFAVAETKITKDDVVRSLLVGVTGSLTITVTPPDAQVAVDGVPRPKAAPGVVRVELAEGGHRVAVGGAPGYEDEEQRVLVLEGEPAALRVSLRRRLGLLTVTVEPREASATVLLDGREEPPGPEGRVEKRLPWGTHEIEVRPQAPGYDLYRSRVEVGEAPRTLSVRLAKIQEPPPPGPRFDDLFSRVLRLTNPAQPIGLRVWSAKERYRIGERAVLYVQADRDSYVTLFNLGTSRRVTMIFPNAWHQQNFVRAGQMVAIPASQDAFVFAIQPPAGVERVKAFATLEPLRLRGEIPSGGFRTIVPQSKTDLDDLESFLSALPGLTWAGALGTFEVAE